MIGFSLSIGRLGVVSLMTAIMVMQAAQPTAALSCVPQGTVAEAESAAIAALKGQRSFGATSFVIGEIVGVDRSGEFPRLDIQATHIFVAGHPTRFDALIRPDGPPALEALHLGIAYFLALRRTEVNSLPVLLVAPCAPIFPIMSQAQLERILDAADYSEAVAPFPVTDGPADPTSAMWPILAVLAIGGGAAVVMHRARPKPQRSGVEDG